jgi:hypothetical protein
MSQAIPALRPLLPRLHREYHSKKRYWEKVQEELEWEDQVQAEVEEVAVAEYQPEVAIADYN